MGEQEYVRFADRTDAGRQLAAHLNGLGELDPVVVALPRGGIPVALEVAEALGAPLEVLAVRKLGAPGNPEYGLGAIAEDGTRLIDPETVAALGVSEQVMDEIVDRERTEMLRRVHVYRGDRPPPDLRDRTVVVVDDGAATGVTDIAAVRAIRRQEPRQIVVAIPVSSVEALAQLRSEADRVICPLVPSDFFGVGQWYRDFDQVSDQEVVDALERSSSGDV